VSLVVTGMRVQFGGVVALDDVGVTLEPGQIHGVIGPNGSGKSTLFNCLSGFVKPRAGQVLLDDDDITSLLPHARIHRGLARTFQTPRLEAKATVSGAIASGFYAMTKSGLLASLVRTPRVRAEEKMIAEGTDELLDRFALTPYRSLQVGQLSFGQVRLVEVARAAAMNPRYLLLDEPAAGLAVGEQELLAQVIVGEAKAGIGVLLVEHNFDLVTSLCELITVLDTGKVLTEGPATAVANDPRVIDAYLGGLDEDASVEA
jgi:ABC-type branched-subunit amino acid transport system ATPase component